MKTPWDVVIVRPTRKFCFHEGKRIAFQSIQDAIDSLPRLGGVVLIHPGTYSQTTVLPKNKKIVLIGGTHRPKRKGVFVASGKCDSVIWGMTFTGHQPKGGPMLSYGHRILNARISKNLTLETLAKKVGTHKGYISGIEHRKVAAPSPDLTRRFCAVLGLDVKEMTTLAWVEKAPALIRDDLIARLKL